MEEQLFLARIKLNKYIPSQTHPGGKLPTSSVEKFHNVMGTSETEVKDKLVAFYKTKDTPGRTHEIVIIDIEETLK